MSDRPDPPAGSFDETREHAPDSEADRARMREPHGERPREIQEPFVGYADAPSRERLARRMLDRVTEGLRTGEAGLEEGPPLETGYEILGELGRGTYGWVFRARDRALGREVALKVQDPDRPLGAHERERFVKEARVLASLDHSSIVGIHSIDEADGRLRLSLELIDGRTLKDVVESDGPLEPTEAARVGIELCRALAAIHGRRLVHQDLKPANAMREKGGRIVLLDFGFAREPHPVGGVAQGTPRIMAPEQFRAGCIVGPKSDLFALGVLLYWLVSGEYPHEARTFDELRDAVLAGKTVPLCDRRSEVPERFVAIVERAMALDPVERHASAGALEAELRAFLAGSEESTVAARRTGSLALPAILVAVAALVLAVLVYVDQLGRDGEGVQAKAASETTSSIRGLETSFWATTDGVQRGLEPGDSIAIGDLVELRVRASEDVHVYVFNQDGDRIANIFPLEGWQTVNPLAAGSEHRLPGLDAKGEERSWTIEVAQTPQEEFLVVVSRGPDELAETLRTSLPDAQELLTSRTTRGVGGTAPTPEVRKDLSLEMNSLKSWYQAALAQSLGSEWRYFSVKNEGERRREGGE